MNSYCQDLHETYQVTINSFKKSYPLCDKQLLKQIDGYSCSCALYIWSVIKVEDSKCVEAINSINSSDFNMEEYTYEYVKSMLERFSSNDYFMPVPEFFHDIISYDESHANNISRKLIAAFKLLDISYAMIEESIQKEQVNIIVNLHNELIKVCDNHNILPLSYDVDPYKYLLVSSEELYVTANRIGDERKIKVEGKGLEKDNSNINVKKIESTSSSRTPMNELESLIGLSIYLLI